MLLANRSWEMEVLILLANPPEVTFPFILGIHSVVLRSRIIDSTKSEFSTTEIVSLSSWLICIFL